MAKNVRIVETLHATSLRRGDLPGQLQEIEGCINCGLCTSRCPSLRALAQAAEFYAGPRDIATSLSRLEADAWAAQDTIYYCTMCGACRAVCPRGIAIPAR